MPLLPLKVTDKVACVHDATIPLEAALSTGLRQGGRGPVTVMIHGFRYLPGHPLHCPHRSILSASPSLQGSRIVSWPRHLGVMRKDAGLGVAFGWPARGSLWAAHRRAFEAGDSLAGVLRLIHHIDPSRQIHIVAHSLGARVALRAIALNEPGLVRRAVLLSAAEFGQTARDALQSPGGADCHVLNVTSRENDVFDFLLEGLIAPPHPGDKALGHGGVELPNLVSWQLDDPLGLAALRRHGHRIAAPARRVCHWSTYRRAGVFALYRAFLSDNMPLDRLRALLPAKTAPRWSRLASRMPSPLWWGLPSGIAHSTDK